MYSIKDDMLHCFCCKMFSKRDHKFSREGLKDWKNANHLLKVHEDSQAHKANMATWGKKRAMALDEGLLYFHLVTIIQSLAERNLAFKGSTDRSNKPNNGSFLKDVAKFDPVMKQHVRVESGAGSHFHYLGKHIQNYLIDSISLKKC